MVRQFGYHSAAVEGLGHEDLDRIFASCRDHNFANGITGFLVHGKGSFLQVLEGEEDFTSETLDRIHRDSRHHSIIQFDLMPFEAREFRAWEMYIQDGARIRSIDQDGPQEILTAALAEPAGRSASLSLFRSFLKTL